MAGKGLRIATLLTGIALAATAASAAVADTGDADTITNTGVDNTFVPAPQLSQRQQLALAEKEDGAEALARSFRTESANAFGPSYVPPPGDDSDGMKYKIAAARDMGIHWQRKSYTCGPASLKNMVKSMNKSFTGHYTSQTEATYEDWLGTHSGGTAIGAFPRVLNERYERFGTWSLRDPIDKWKFLAYVAQDTYEYKQPLIQGVRTGYLDYWNDKWLNHFNVAYGFNSASPTKWIYILEVFDPVRLYGYRPWYGNPHGHQASNLYDTFTANNVSCANCADRRRLVV